MPMKRILTTATILFSMILTCCAGGSEEAELRQRLAEYEWNWMNQRYDKVWGMMVESLEDEDGSEERQFIDFIRRSEGLVTRMEAQETQIHGERATVRVHTAVRSLEGPEIGQEIIEQYWVKIDGIWYLEDYRSLESIDMLE
jgi:hypothetical protein